MIVVDENSSSETVLAGIRSWYRGKVCSIRTLLPGAVIKDEMIPRLLARESQPTFVTTNVSDFWHVVRPGLHYCIVCLPLPNDQLGEFSSLLRRILRMESLRTKRARMGMVIVSRQSGVRLYRVGNNNVVNIPWQVGPA